MKKPFHRDIAFTLGEWVYYRPSQEPFRGLITGLQFDIGGGLLYRVCWENKSDTSHYELELSTYFERPPDDHTAPEPNEPVLR